MAQSSPSEFLTFMRRASSSQALRYRTVARPAAFRPFTASVRSLKDSPNSPSPNIITDKGTQHDTGAGAEQGGSRKHAIDKGDEKDPNVQSHSSSGARADRAKDTGGSATRQKDERNSTEKAKKDHPEAPDVVIGMQDERGGKGAQ